jgi:hypothetical protein
MLILAFILAGLGALLAALNFYLSFVRYPLHRLVHEGRPFKFASGIPLVGSVLLWAGAYILLSGGAWKFGAVALILSAFDTGGIHWFLISFGYQWLRGRQTKTDA